MSEHSFDKYVRDKLSNYASPVPDGLWNKIVQEKKRKPAAIWWQSKIVVFAGLLFTTLAIGGFMLFQKQQVLKQQTQVVETKSAIAVQPLKENSLTETNNEQFNHQIETTTPTDANKQETVTANQETSSTNSYTKSSSSLSIVATNKMKLKKAIPNKNIVESIAATTNDVQLNSGFAKNKISKNTKKINSINSQNNWGSTLNSNEPLNGFSFSKAQLQTISWNKPFVTEKNTTGLQVNLFKPKDCPGVNGNIRNDWYVELYASPDYVMKKTFGTENSTAYLAKKDSSEAMRGGFTLGARITKNITENILLKAGIQFAQMNEKLSLRRENERRVITVVTIKTVTDASGNVSTVSDTSTVIQIGYVESNSYNYYRNIELPVSLSYETGNKNFKTAINAGVILNIASWYKGKVLDTSFQMVNVSPKENDGIAKHSVGLSLYGSISFIKPVNEQTDVFAEPYFRYNISSLQNTAYNFSQRFSAIGLNLGVRYKLNYRKQHF